MAPAPSTPMGPQPLARRGLLGHDEPVGTDADGRGRPGHDGWGGSRVTPQPSSAVMPGLEPGIHVFAPWWVGKTWMAGTGPAMTGGAGSRVTPQPPSAVMPGLEPGTPWL